MVDIDDDLFEEVLKEQRKKEGRNPQRAKYRTRVEQAYEVLVETAKNEETIYYGELMDEIGTGRNYIGPVLGGVSRIELREDPENPALSALVLRKKTDLPGNGFWENLLRDVGRWEPGKDREAAWERELQRAYDAYGE